MTVLPPTTMLLKILGDRLDSKGGCTLLLYETSKGRFQDRNWPLIWVGITEFEPAASSPRSHVHRSACSAAFPLVAR
jgi:hypothetical protein